MKRVSEMLKVLRKKCSSAPQSLSKIKSWIRENSQQIRSNGTVISVCHVNLARTSLLRGGTKQTEVLIRALADQEACRQRVVILAHGSLANRFSDIPNLEVYKVRNRLSALFVCLSSRRNAFLLHAHDTQATQIAFIASLFRGRYLITRRFVKPLRSILSYIKYRNAQAIVTLSKAVDDSIRSRFSDIPTVRIPDAYSQDAPDQDASQEIRRRFAGKFLIGHAAAMEHPEKGHSILLQSARILQPDFPDIHFILLGSGCLENELRQEANDLNNVYFAGWVENPITWINSFDIFAFPSLREALGSVLLDVLRMGRPIVASRVGGIPDVVTKDCGILVPPGDAKALAEKLVQLFHSASLRQRLANASILRSKRYSPALMAKRYMEVYQSL